MMKLYMTYRSPYARKLRIALLEKNIEFEEESVDLFNRSEEFWELNPSGTVPTLVTDDHLVLGDSTLALHYLEDCYPEVSLISNDTHPFETWVWEDLADRLCDQQIVIFFEKQKDNPDDAKLKKAEKITHNILTLLNEQLSDHDFILGEFSLADIAFGASLLWMEFRLNFDLGQYGENIKKWAHSLNERPSFQKTLPKLD